MISNVTQAHNYCPQLKYLRICFLSRRRSIMGAGLASLRRRGHKGDRITIFDRIAEDGNPKKSTI